MSDEHPVKLYVYDLTNGMARAFSPMLLGEVVGWALHSAECGAWGTCMEHGG